jgi:acetyl-CoA synthetase
MTEQAAIESILHEERVFPPPPEFAEKAHVKSFEEYEKLYDEAAKDVPAFWAKQAETLDWFEKWHTVLEWKEPFAKWFVGGKINISYNCLDRHITTWRKNKAAFIWEGEPGEQRTLTYLQLHREVCRFANVLKKLGFETGRPRCFIHAAHSGTSDRDACRVHGWARRIRSFSAGFLQTPFAIVLMTVRAK